MNVTINYIKNILREIHYPKKWWEDNFENGKNLVSNRGSL